MLPIDRDFLIQAILDSTTSVFRSMLDSEVMPGPAGVGGDEMEGGLVSLVGLTGPWRGTGSLSCTPGVAQRLCARLLSMEPPPETESITDEIMDAIAELTNMILGNIKHILEDRVGPMGINIPMVIYGRNFQFKRACGACGLSVPFRWESDWLDVRLFLAPAAEKTCMTRAGSEPMILQRA